ncbi:MAG: hypothetical protein GY792_08475 [Gammaproteobacteria bacterium]|nr:hypothetical protein [Gammaproteobacteria bacterium]
MGISVSVPIHRIIIVWGLFLYFFSSSDPAYAESRVFRCTSAAGQITFSQTGCEHGIRESLLVKNPDVGWINLKTVVEKFKKQTDRNGGKRSKRKRRASKVRGGDQAQRQRCWRARKKITRIDRELKHGYKLSRGEALRYQRTEQKEYLALFCKELTP